MKYLVIFEKGESSYGAYVPDLPGCVAVGESLQVSMSNSPQLAAKKRKLIPRLIPRSLPRGHSSFSSSPCVNFLSPLVIRNMSNNAPNITLAPNSNSIIQSFLKTEFLAA